MQWGQSVCTRAIIFPACPTPVVCLTRQRCLATSEPGDRLEANPSRALIICIVHIHLRQVEVHQKAPPLWRHQNVAWGDVQVQHLCDKGRQPRACALITNRLVESVPWTQRLQVN